MKVAGSYENAETNEETFVDIVFEPKQELGNNATEAVQANKRVFGQLAQYMAAAIDYVKNLPAPLTPIAVQMISEAIHEALNNAMILAERIEGGEDPNEILAEYVERNHNTSVGDMVETEHDELDAFSDFIQKDLDLRTLDGDVNEVD